MRLFVLLAFLLSPSAFADALPGGGIIPLSANACMPLPPSSYQLALGKNSCGHFFSLRGMSANISPLPTTLQIFGLLISRGKK